MTRSNKEKRSNTSRRWMRSLKGIAYSLVKHINKSFALFSGFNEGFSKMIHVIDPRSTGGIFASVRYQMKGLVMVH